MTAPAIRPLTLADRRQWAGLRLALWPYHTIDDLDAELESMLAEGFVGFGAFVGDELVAFAEASERPFGDGCDTSPVAWLEGIYVKLAYRRHALGRRLVDAVVDWAKARGLTELGSDAEIENLQSRVTHARWGFAETERIVRYRRVIG